MSKTHTHLEDDYIDDGDDEYLFRETQSEKREKQRRQTEIRRKMEDKLERRRLTEQLGMYLDELDFDELDRGFSSR